MTSHILKNNIKLYLSRFETLVRISSLNNEYDINKHSETFLIPFLKKVYGWNLVNANIIDKNAKSIDLIDLEKKIAIQVSSDNSLEKVKTTLQKFLLSKYKDKINKIYFYFLLPKQKSYSNEAILKVTKKRIKFSIKSNIYDNSDVYNSISNITEVKKLREIEEFLRSEFSDFYIKDNVTINDFESFKAKYKESCIINYTRLNFFGLSIPHKPREVQLYSLFVKPDFSLAKKEHLKRGTFRLKSKSLFLGFEENIPEFKDITFLPNIIKPSKVSSEIQIKSESDIKHLERFLAYESSHEKEISFNKLFDLNPHIVLLGNPGAGKSSLVKYSICKIIEEDYQVFNNEEIYNYLPYRIELHRYNQFKKQKKGGFLDFIKANLIEEFQIVTKPNILNEIIEKFPSVIFFDGLDEIFDIQERLQVRNDIENFIKQYPLIKSVVTSRYESYEEVKLNHDIYVVLDVKDFNNRQISEYVERWYNIEEESEKVRKQEVKGCLLQLKNVDGQLKHNPLLLSLILILYRNEQDLPTSKLEIYEGCANTIIETRDKKEKKIDFELKVTHKISVFSNLAFWQFKKEEDDKGVVIDYITIENYITKYLLDKGAFDDLSEARDAAKQFLEYAKLRSIYFENKFTHKTFYEYFTAYYIYSNFYSTPGEYLQFQDLLLKNIGLSSWAVILELLICKIDNTQIEYKVMDRIVDFLLENKPYETYYLFGTVMPHLRTLSPLKTRTLILSMAKYISSKDNKPDNRYVLGEKLLDLIKVKRFRDAYCVAIENELKNNTESSACLFDLTFELQVVTKSKDLKSIIETYKHYETYNKAKYFIISNIDAITDRSKSLPLLREAIKTYGKVEALKAYESNYRLPSFNKSFSFNWVIGLMSACKTKSDYTSLDKALLELGIDKSDVPKILEYGASNDLIFKDFYISQSRQNDLLKDTTILMEINKKWIQTHVGFISHDRFIISA